MFVSGVHSCHFFGKCQASTPDQKLEVPEGQYAPPILHYACIFSPLVAAAEKKTCLIQRSKGFGHGVVVANI